MTTLYGISNCDTIKKARKWLSENDIDYTFHDYKKAGITAKTLKEWTRELEWETLLNKRGTTWRKLPDAVKEKVTKASALTLMVENPSLIKRPVLEHRGQRHVGFTENEYAEILGDRISAG
ncbi:MAG: ArsC family reductase [Gammaproteobacteria bacterium]|nr:ArsC family reductase [Gammaproteobacteria bacterium]